MIQYMGGFMLPNYFDIETYLIQAGKIAPMPPMLNIKKGNLRQNLCH
jgi:hypothetical protein